MNIPIEIYNEFFEDFFFYFNNEHNDLIVNKSIKFIQDNIDAEKTTCKTIKEFLHCLFLNILSESLSDYEKEYLIIEKDVKISFFKSEHYLMPECFINALDYCSRDDNYNTLKYTLINFMYSIINSY